MHTIWGECLKMGSKLPKPDYVAGLSEAAFDADNIEEIKQFHTRTTPIRVSPGLLSPYLVCEAKSGAQGILAAEFQNTHAGGILVRTMFELYKTAYQEEEPDVLLSLCEKIIVWSMDINHANVDIYGHYGVLEDITDTSLSSLRIYRHPIKNIRLNLEAERFIPYNFVRNIYKDFVPIHISRIRDALTRIRENRDSVDASAISLTSGQSPNSKEESVINLPPDGTPETLASVAVLKQQLTMLIEQSERQAEQLTMMMEERTADRAQIEQQREEYQARFKQQKEESKTQVNQLREIIDLLKKGSTT